MTKSGTVVGIVRRQTPESLKALHELVDAILDQGHSVEIDREWRGFDTAKNITPVRRIATDVAAG